MEHNTVICHVMAFQPMLDLIQDNGPIRFNGTEFPVRKRDIDDTGELALSLASAGLGSTVSLPHL